MKSAFKVGLNDSGCSDTKWTANYSWRLFMLPSTGVSNIDALCLNLIVFVAGEHAVRFVSDLIWMNSYVHHVRGVRNCSGAPQFVPMVKGVSDFSNVWAKCEQQLRGNLFLIILDVPQHLLAKPCNLNVLRYSLLRTCFRVACRTCVILKTRRASVITSRTCDWR